MQVDVRSPIGQPLSHVRTTWLQEYTNDSPTAATWNGVLYVSWAGTSSNKPIYIKHFDTAWSPPTIISGANGRPSLFPTSANRLTILYRGNNQIIYTVGSSDGTTFGSSQPNAATSNFSPAPFLLSSAGLWTLDTGTTSHVYTSAMLQ